MRTIGVVVVLGFVGCGVSAEVGDDPEVGVAARRQPTISSVETDDEFTQIRQNASVVLVIRGDQLGKTRGVRIGGFSVLLDSVGPHEVRVSLFTDGATPLGPLDVTLTSPRGDVTSPGAIELTPFVVSPAATTGHGTFQSPMNLCDPELAATGGSSRVRLLAGTHHCDRLIFIGSGTTIEGDPDAATIITGTRSGGPGLRIDDGGSTTVSTVRDITFAPPLAEWSIDAGQGTLLVERVDDAGGIRVSNGGFARIAHYAYAGEGTGLEADLAEITSTSVRHCGAADGIRVIVGTLDDVLVEDCDRGIVAGIAGARDGGGATISNSQLIDNRLGVQLDSGSSNLSNVVIRDDESTPQSSLIGVMLRSGDLAVTDVEISGQEQIGIAVAQPSSNGFDAVMFADRVTIVGGQIGISFTGMDNNMSLHRSIVRDQTQASIYISSLDSFINLSGPPGTRNALSVVSGFAIDDARHGTHPVDVYIPAAGTTLNGVSFDGQTIDGPAELAPYYRLQFSEQGLQF